MNKDMFIELESNIEDLNKQEKSLLALQEQMDKADCFDDDDLKLIESKLSELQSRRKKLESTLAKKREIYQKKIKGMERQILKRQQTLEHIDKKQAVFREFPDVLDYFARKQSKLNDSLASLKHSLQQP